MEQLGYNVHPTYYNSSKEIIMYVTKLSQCQKHPIY